MHLPVWSEHKLFLGVLLLCAATSMFAQEPSVVELQKNWQLISANEVAEAGAAISQPAYDASKWHPIHQMPATVLEILEEDGVYPNLYYGMNFLKVPPDLWKQDWWYRTRFDAPSGKHTIWIDFPGINYRAQIWINGKLLAGDKQVVGMYVDHQFNVTTFVRPGQVNVIAVKVTPEQLIPYVNGVELADSWANWINYHHFGPQSPLNVKDLKDLPQSAGVSARFYPPSGQQLGSATTTVAVASASAKELTITATVSSDGRPITSGTVEFLKRAKSIGRSPVNENGAATLHITDSQEIADIEKSISQPSFVPDRNAGIWKPVTLSITGPVALSNALVNTRLPLPSTASATLTVHANVVNGTSVPVQGTLEGEITRHGKPTIHISQPVTLSAGETKEVSFASSEYPQLIVQNPDLWWPYTMGKPALYDLHLKFVEDNEVSDTESIRFGIREITQHRDNDEQFPTVGTGGSFYIQVNGRNYLIRGAAYTPDLLFRYDPNREANEIKYVKDMGLNMLRWESKISSEHILNLADEAGVPVMLGWMCCDQWELWKQWSAEDYKVAPESLRSQILMLRSHASAFIWANGSDGLPPNPVLDRYHQVLNDLHWQNATVDTVASYARDANGKPKWAGIHMKGPYTWRPPSYWFAGRYVGARGAVAEQGDNENIPPYESLTKFIPPNKLWPPNDYWYLHAGALRGSSKMTNLRLAIDHRYGPAVSAQDLAEKAQLAAYEDTRAQFEDFAANGWANHKMTIYWMMTSVWPSFYGHLYDYYLKPGGAYYGAKKGLRPLSAVFDYYAAGDHSKGHVIVVNQTTSDQSGLRLRVRIYDVNGKQQLDRSANNVIVAYGGAVPAITLPRLRDITPTYFVRCDLYDRSGKQVVENVYWQSTTLDDIGGYVDKIDDNQQIDWSHAVSWADFTALNTMAKVELQMSATSHWASGNDETVVIKLHNPSSHVAFFERVAITNGKDGDEILPILYSDNYITVFPGQTVSISGTYAHNLLKSNDSAWLRLEGYNTNKQLAPIHP